MHHVEINGVGYRLAEDAEGQHYNLSGEPLRPPNAVTVQGETSQKFQMRPDAMLWTLTDWSGGEGQLKFDPQNPGRWKELTGVRAFENPGALSPGYYVEDTQDSTGSSDLAVAGMLVGAIESLYLLDFDSATAYKWDATNKKWDAGTSLTGVSNGVNRSACGDRTHIFWQESTTNDIWKWDGSGSPEMIADSLGSRSYMATVGGYVYVVDPNTGIVNEVAKDGTGTTTIDDFSEETGTSTRYNITSLDGKLYVLVSLDDRTMVREITPTTAAGTGFGAEISRIHGFTARSIWSHSGTLFMSGNFGKMGEETILYLVPGGEYGSLGRLRPDTNLGETVGAQSGAAMLHHFMVADQVSSTDAQAVYQIDSISGGVAVLAVDEDGDAASESSRGVAVFQGDIFFSNHSGSPDRTRRAYAEGYTKASEAVSPWHDFALSDEKILSSLVLSMEALPADWRVRVDYATDGSDSWTNAIDVTTTSSTGTKTKVSTDSSTQKFRTLAIRIRMDYTGAGIPTSGPEILGVDALVMVAKPIPVWRLLLDLSDDKSRAGGFSGYRKKQNLESASASESVVAFKDYYGSHEPGVFDEYDVVIDDYQIVLSHQGEGIAAVTLKETV